MMFMRKIILNLLFCFLGLPVFSATDVATLWKAMPDSVIPYFNAGLRTEMVDMYKIDRKTVSKNILGGACWIDSLSDDIMSLHINKYTSLIIAAYQKSDSTQIICVVKSFGSPATESSVSFYTEEWKNAENNYGLPTNTDCEAIVRSLTYRPDTMSAERYAEIIKKLEPVMVVADVNEDKEIEFEINCPLLTAEERRELEAVKKKKCFKWNGETFK